MTPTEKLLQQLAAQAQAERRWEDAIFQRVTDVIGRYAAARAEMIALLGPVLVEPAEPQPVPQPSAPAMGEPTPLTPEQRVEAEFQAARREALENREAELARRLQ